MLSSWDSPTPLVISLCDTSLASGTRHIMTWVRGCRREQVIANRVVLLQRVCSREASKTLSQIQLLLAAANTASAGRCTQVVRFEETRTNTARPAAV